MPPRSQADNYYQPKREERSEFLIEEKENHYPHRSNNEDEERSGILSRNDISLIKALPTFQRQLKKDAKQFYRV